MDIFPPFTAHKTSDAEKLVFDLIQRSNPGDNYQAFHSLLLPHHRHKYVGETDFVVLTPCGILILEVKGGVLAVGDRVWTVETKRGEIRQLPESPFKQANGNMYSLKDEIERAALPFLYLNHLLGYGVIFPDCSFDATGADISPELLMDSKDLAKPDPVADFIKQIEEYWLGRLRAVPQPFTGSEKKQLRNWFRPRYHGVRSLRAHQVALEEKMVSLLPDQMDFLATARGKERVICKGGAGTGKTLVGLEHARLKRDDGVRCLFVVPGDRLREYLIARGYDGELITSIPKLEKIATDEIDLVVLDEAQDAMTIEHFTEIDRVLKNGLENGEWVILLDSENQTGIEGDYDEEWYKYIQSIADTEFFLPRNIRNPIEIIDITWKLTGKDIGKKGTGVGGKVQFIEYADPQDLGYQVKEKIQEYESLGLDQGNITILGRGDVEHSQLVEQLKLQGCQVAPIDGSNINDFPFPQISYSSIGLFKGWESYVIIIDTDGFEVPELEGNLFYVAVTRAVGHLILAYPRSLRRELGKIQLRHIQQKH
jgi:hypothetical protein